MKGIASVLAVLAVLFSAVEARAYSFSDLYYTPGQDGWGANIIQQNNVLFITIFVYGANGQATWLVGPATVQQPSGSFTGALYQTTGPFYGTTFNPSAVTARQVGTVTFTYNTLGGGTLSYSADGTNVTKQVVRQTWAAVPANGTYYGTLTQQTTSTCNRISTPQALYARYVVSTTGVGSGTVNFNFALYQGSTNTFPQSCTIAGPFTQFGSQISQTTTSSFSCFLGSGLGQVFFDVQADGISGGLALVDGAGTCADYYTIFASRN